MMTETEQAISSLRSYSTTSWENGGPGESTMVSKVRLVLAEVERLQAIVSKVAKTADEVPVVPEMDVWFCRDKAIQLGTVLVLKMGEDFTEVLVHSAHGEDVWLDCEDCYSTREAAKTGGE